MKRCTHCDGIGLDRATHRSIGGQLRLKRLAAGLTLRALAAAVGTDHGYLSLLETGKRKWSADMVQRVTAAVEREGVE